MPLFDRLALLLEKEPRGAAMNMALDEALLRTAAQPLLRCYRWVLPAVSFGYFVRHAEVSPLLAGREAVRRWTGGGIVPHGDDFTYTLVIPAGCPLARLGPAESYRLIHAVVAAALGGASLAPATQRKVSEACFENPAESDVLLGARKVAGAAQRRTAAGLLHQGSVQVPGLGGEFARSLAAAFSPVLMQHELGPELRLAETIAAERYETEAWLRRR
jgi:lipoate-protein ligase A